MTQRIIALLFSCIFSIELYAQGFNYTPKEFSDEVHANTIQAASTAGYYQFTVTHDDWTELTGGQQTQNCLMWDCVFKSVQNYVKLKVDPDYAKATAAYKYRFEFEVKTYHVSSTPAVGGSNISGTPGSPTSPTTETAYLDFRYDPQSGVVHNDMVLFKTSKGLKMEVKLTRIEDLNNGNAQLPLSAFPSNLMVEGVISAEKVDLINTNAPLVFSSYSNGSLNLNWLFYCSQFLYYPAPEAVDYELEWTYVDDYEVDLATTGTPVTNTFATSGNSIHYNFKDNATRIRLSSPGYSIPVAYQRGAIVYRVRTLRPDPTNYTDVIYGDWSLPESGSMLVSGAGGKAFIITTAHEQDKINWSYSIDFAEEGKYKHVINYFDGGLKNRQTQTKVNTDNDYLVAVDRSFDYEGRPVISSLPTPIYSPSNPGLHYDDKILVTGSTLTALTAEHFDQRSGSTSCVIPATPITALQADNSNNKSKAEYYYSADNQDQADMQRFVPRSDGYPFVQTVFSPESGSKPLVQGGAGPQFQIAQGKHFTMYDYTLSSQSEIDRVLGTEAGKYQFYPKIVQTDPNGQSSFTIMNKYGKPVISGLAGSNPANMQSLPGTASYTLKSDLLKNFEQNRQDGVLKAEGSFYMDVNGNSSLPVLKYSADIKPYKGCSLLVPPGSYPFNYIQLPGYLKLNVLDACGTSVMQSSQPFTANIGSGTVQYGDGTSSLVYPLSSSNLLNPSSLTKGKFSFVKELVFKKEDMVSAARLFITQNPQNYGGSTSYQCRFDTRPRFVGDEVLKITESCETVDGNDANEDDFCSALKQKMKEEMYPGAKYGKYNKTDGDYFCSAPSNSIFSMVEDPAATIIIPDGQRCKVNYNHDLYPITGYGWAYGIYNSYYVCDRGFEHHYTYDLTKSPCGGKPFTWLKDEEPGCHADYSRVAKPVQSPACAPATMGYYYGSYHNSTYAPGSGGEPSRSGSYPDASMACQYGYLHRGVWLWCGGARHPDYLNTIPFVYYPNYVFYMLDEAGIHENTPPYTLPCSCSVPAGIQACNITVEPNAFNNTQAEIEFLCTRGKYHKNTGLTISHASPVATGVYCHLPSGHSGQHELFYHIGSGGTGPTISTAHTTNCSAPDPVFRYKLSCLNYDGVVAGGRTYQDADIKELSPDQFIAIFNDAIAERLLELHPEYCKLQACDAEFMEELNTTETFVEAKLKYFSGSGYVTHTNNAVLLSSFYPSEQNTTVAPIYPVSNVEGIMGSDPLFTGASSGSQAQTRYDMLRLFPIAVNAVGTVTNEPIDKIALRKALCDAGSLSEEKACAAYVYNSEITSGFFGLSPSVAMQAVLDRYWQNLRALYIATHNKLKLEIMRGAISTTCTDCGTGVLTLIGDPVSSTIAGYDKTASILEMEFPDGAFSHPDINMEALYGFSAASEINDVIQNPTYTGSPGTIPLPNTYFSDALHNGSNNVNSRVAEDFLVPIKLALGTNYTATLALIKAKLDDGKANEITPDYLNTYLNGLSLTKGVNINAYLLNYNLINPLVARVNPYNCAEPALYSDLKTYLNYLQGLSYPATITLDNSSSNRFEKKLAEFFQATSPISASVTRGSQNDGIHNDITDFTITYNSVSTSLYFTGFKMAPYVSAQLDVSFTEAGCINDLPVPNTGYIAKGTAMLKGQWTQWSTTYYEDYLFWSKDIEFMTDNPDDEFSQAVNCWDIIDAVKAYHNNAGTYGYATYYDDPFYLTSLTNFINYKLSRNYTPVQYEDLMKGCAVSDHIELRRNPVLYEYFCTGLAVGEMINTLVAAEANHPEVRLGLDAIEIRHQNPSVSGTFYVLDFGRVPLDQLQFALDYVNGFTSAPLSGTVTQSAAPSSAYAATVFIPHTMSFTVTSGLSIASTMLASIYEQGQTVYYDKYTLNFDNSLLSPADPKGQSDALEALVTYLDAGSFTGYQIWYGRQILRSKDYHSVKKQAYLNYISGASISGHGSAVTAIATGNTSLHTALSASAATLSYKDPLCKASLHDLYIYPATTNSDYTVLQNILGAYSSLVTNGTTTSGSLADSRQFRKASGTYWFYYVNKSNQYKLYNVYILPPAGKDIAGATIQSGTLVPTHCDENGNVYAFNITVTLNSANVVCRGYTDFPIAIGGVKLQDVLLYDGPDKRCENTVDCEYQKLVAAELEGNAQYNQYVTRETDRLVGEMMQHVANPANVTEVLELEKDEKQYQYTLYSYDRAGNLIRTVPPEGVVPIASQSLINAVDGYRNAAAGSGNAWERYRNATFFKKSSEYKYNSLNQLTEQTTPDGGTSRFYYDTKGRLTFSQNAQQAARGTYYSYTLYDALDRIVETGEIKLPAPVAPATNPPIIQSLLANTADYTAIYNAIRNSLLKRDVVLTEYDVPTLKTADLTDANYNLSEQTNLRKRVACVKFFPVAGQTNIPSWKDNPEYALHYSYDVLGNVSTLTHEIKELGGLRQKYKRVDYDYDVWSGKVNMVSYNRGFPDQFYYRYRYDADNRIKTAESSNDGVIWAKDAVYDYYKHGPLSRMMLGEHQVQSVEYAYTLQGWLKAINGDVLNPNLEMGRDGIPSSSIDPTAQDAIAHSLDYFEDDYEPIGTTPVENLLAAQNPKSALTAASGLFNGNIARQYTSIASLGANVNNIAKGMERTYQYDQLNRIIQATNKNTDNTIASGTQAVGIEITHANHYKTDYSYDKDGNLLTLNRWDGQATPAKIDQLSYNYHPSQQAGAYTYTQNKLLDVAEGSSVAIPGYTDIRYHPYGPTLTHTYDYDASGNLVKDKRDKLDIDWNAYGKVKSVKVSDPADPHTLFFGYDGLGNRVRKSNDKALSNGNEERNTEHYIRDAGGNVLTVYKVKSVYTQYPLIKQRNDDIVNEFGVDPFTVFVNGVIASEAGLRTAVFDSAIAQAPSWVSASTSGKTADFYFHHDLETQNEYLGSNDSYLDDFRDYTIGAGNGANYFGYALTSTESEEARLFMVNSFAVQAATTAHLKEFATHIPEDIAVNVWNYFGQQWVTGDAETSAQILADYIHTNNMMDELSHVMRDALDVLDEVEPEGEGTSKLNYFTAVINNDDVFKDSDLRGAFRTDFEQSLVSLLTHHPDREPLMDFLEQYTDALTWVTDSVPALNKLNIIYNVEPTVLLKSLIQTAPDAVHGALSDVNGMTLGDYDNLVAKVGLTPTTATATTSTVTEELSLAEHHLYGSSHLGIQYYDATTTPSLPNSRNYVSNVHTFPLNTVVDWYSQPYSDLVHGNGRISPWNYWSSAYPQNYSRSLGMRHYSLTDHLGNVLATVLDRKTGHINPSATTDYDYWQPDVASAQDYYPFGMLMPGRILQGDKYRFGFNTQEKVNEIAGVGNHMTALFWEYDTRLGRRWNLDPKPQVNMSDYAVNGNSPIWYNDPLGDVKNKNGSENTKSNPEVLNSVTVSAKGTPKAKPSGRELGGSGNLNIWQAANRDIGRNDYNRAKVDNFNKIVMGQFAIGATPLVGMAGGTAAGTAAWSVAEGIGLKAGDWMIANLLKTGGAWAGVNALGGTADFAYQALTKEPSDINYASVFANTTLGPLPSAAVGYTFDFSANALSGQKPWFNTPFSIQGAISIGVGTLFNYGAGAVGDKVGVPKLRLGTTEVPNIFGPSVNIGVNAAGNAGSDEVVNKVLEQ